MATQFDAKAGLRNFVEWLTNPEIFAAALILAYLDILWLHAFYQSAAWLAFAYTVGCNLALFGVLLWEISAQPTARPDLKPAMLAVP